MKREELKAEALINLGSEPAPKEWEKLPCIKEQMPSCVGGEVSLQRFVGTDICAWFVGIGGLWEPQSEYFRVSLPPAEGAEEVTAEEFIREKIRQKMEIKGEMKGLWTYGCNGEDALRWAHDFATLHAQRIADKKYADTEADGYVFCGKCGKMKEI